MEDRKLFKGAAQYYSRYRLGYPPAFFDHIAKMFSLDEKSRALDLGAGTGQLAIPLAKRVKEVIAVDPEKEMLEEGARQAEKQGASNIRWIQSRAEDISDDLGFFKVTTMGASFHWMQQDEVLDKIYPLTENGGGIVICANVSTMMHNTGKDAWKDVAWEVIKEFLGEKRRAGDGTYTEPKDRFENIIARSKFQRFQTYTDTWTVQRTVEDILGYLASTSFASQRLFGDRLSDFEKTLTERLLKLEPAGTFTEKAVLEAYLAWK